MSICINLLVNPLFDWIFWWNLISPEMDRPKVLKRRLVIYIYNYKFEIYIICPSNMVWTKMENATLLFKVATIHGMTKVSGNKIYMTKTTLCIFIMTKKLRLQKPTYVKLFTHLYYAVINKPPYKKPGPPSKIHVLL